MENNNGNPGYSWILAGFFFAILWASAATATKISLTVAQPFVISVIRFGIAAIIMLCIAHLWKRERLPFGKEWTQIALYGFLNVTVYLGVYVIAMQYVTAGIGALAIAANPVLISFFSVILLKQKLSLSIYGALLICMAGVAIAAWPLMQSAEVSPIGLGILLLSMVSYSAASLYFSSRNWKGLNLFTINGWQTFFGGLFLLPVTILLYKEEANEFNQSFWTGVLWLAIPVSIVAVQLWLWLLQKNAVRAGLWLFICPPFGFLFAAWWMGDKISLFTVVGVSLVIAGLWLSRLKPRKHEILVD